MARFPGRSSLSIVSRAVGALLAVLIVLGLSVACLISVSRGVFWGLTLAQTPTGVVADQVTVYGLAADRGIRRGQLVILVDGQDARGFVWRSLDAVHNVTLDAAGAQKTVGIPENPAGLPAVMVTIALTFVLLGAAVYRWAQDFGVGLGFLILSTAVASALAAVPAATFGYAWAVFVSGAASVVASSSLVGFALIFPRPYRWARRGLLAVGSGALALVGLITFFFASDVTYPDLLNTGLWLWMAASLLVGILLLGLRARNPVDRRTLVPVAIGVVVGVAPLVLLDVLPHLLLNQALAPPEVASLGTVAIPLGLAYAILRHHLFALDAWLRRTLLWFVVAATYLGIAGSVAVVLRLFVSDPLAIGLTSALIAAIVTPVLAPPLQAGLDASVYAASFQARTGALFGGQSAAPEIGAALTARVRQLVPTRWAALVGHAVVLGEPSLPDYRYDCVALSLNGDVPSAALPTAWINGCWEIAREDSESTLIPIVGGATVLGALLVGPRLDGSPLSGLDLDAIQTLAGKAAAPLEAALFREQTQAEIRFREGLSRFARELAAAGAVEDVLRLTAAWTARLLAADAALVWQRVGEEAFELVEKEGVVDDAFVLDRIAEPPLATVTPDGGPIEVSDRSLALFRLGQPNAYDVVVVALRRPGRPFGSDLPRRLVEIAEHTNGALGRAHALAAAAEAETLREINRFRTGFLEMVSHDLQSPLTVVQGFAELLQIHADEADAAFVRTAADSILASFASCQRLIDDLLTTSRIEGGHLTLHSEDFDARGLLIQLVEGYRVMPDGHRVSLLPGEALAIHADRARVEQMVGNLVTNALRYAPSGPITVSLRGGPGQEVWIEVTDRGPGISEADQAKIWEKFYRSASANRGTRGTGVGLSVVRTLAELHGGHAEVESEPGQGSTFRIALPAARPEAEPAVEGVA